MIISDGLEIELILQTGSSMGRITSMTFCIQPFLKSHSQAIALYAEVMAQLSPFAALTKTTNLCNNLQTVTYIIHAKMYSGMLCMEYSCPSCTPFPKTKVKIKSKSNKRMICRISKHKEISRTASQGHNQTACNTAGQVQFLEQIYFKGKGRWS